MLSGRRRQKPNDNAKVSSPHSPAHNQHHRIISPSSIYHPRLYIHDSFLFTVAASYPCPILWQQSLYLPRQLSSGLQSPNLCLRPRLKSPSRLLRKRNRQEQNTIASLQRMLMLIRNPSKPKVAMVRVPAAPSPYLRYPGSRHANRRHRMSDLQGQTIKVRRNQASLSTM